jgi:enoyl-[acyl-carrier protein] reductase I
MNEISSSAIGAGLSQLMAGKRGLIMGVANDRSLAWGIAGVAAAHGAQLAFSYQGDALGKRVRPLAASVGSAFVEPCDVADDASLDALFEKIASEWGGLDFVVHAIGFADKEDLKGGYVKTSRAGFHLALDISAYSFTAVAQRAAPLMKNGGSMLTLSYLGADRVVPHYNVMGVAKAALKTLAGSGIGDFRVILRWNELNAPLGRNVTIQDVGNCALYLLSDLGSGVTGQIQYVDGGYNTVGMVAVEAAAGAAALLQGLVDRGVVPDAES